MISCSSCSSIIIISRFIICVLSLSLLVVVVCVLWLLLVVVLLEQWLDAEGAFSASEMTWRPWFGWGPQRDDLEERW